VGLPEHPQRFQAVPVPVPLVGEEPLGVLGPQRLASRLPPRLSRYRPDVERRTKEGLSKREIILCLKRYVAREVYRHLRDGA
jgi:hypothetical protein